MKKIIILSIMLLTFFVLPRVTVNGVVIEDDQSNVWNLYSWGIKGDNDYLVEPLGIGFDFTTYDNFSYQSFFNTVAMISLGAFNSSGTPYETHTTFRQLFVEFFYNVATDDLSISIYGDKYGNTSFDNLGSAILYDISDELPFMLIGFDLTSNTDNSSLYEDRSVTFRIGSKTARISLSSSFYTSLAFQQHFDISVTYDPSIQFYYDWAFRDYYITNPINYFAGADDVDLYLGNVASVNSDIFDVVMSLAYDQGFQQGSIDGRNEVDGLLSVAQLVIGVVVNFVLFFATIEVYGISLVNIFATLIAVIGVVWVLKAVRG